MDKKVNLALLGCGYWGPNLLRNFKKVSRVGRLLVCDRDQMMLEKVIAEFSGIEISTSIDAALQDSDIDAVAIALPAILHYQTAKDALWAGKHVLVEKPLAMSCADGEELVRIGREKHRVIMVGHTFIYNAAVRWVKKYIDSGELGDIYYIFSQRLNLGRVRADINAMWNLAPHDISIILYWLEEEPDQVFARGVSFLQEGIEDLVFVHLGFPSGKSAHVHVSWLSPRKTREVVVVGSKKMLVYDDTSAEARVVIYDKGIDKNFINRSGDEILDYALFNLRNRSGDVWLPKIDFDEPLKAECRHFIDCVISGQKPNTAGEDGLQVVKVLEQAQALMKRN